MARALVLSIVTGTLLVGGGCGSLVYASRDISLHEPWADYERIEVQVRNGSVELASGGGDGIQITGKLRVGGATLTEARSNLDELEIRAAADPANPRTFRVELHYPLALKGQCPAASLRISVPEPCSAKIETTNGGIQVQGLKGAVELDSSNGAIAVRDVAGAVRVGTSNGRVEVENVSGSLEGRSSNGAVVAREIGGPCDLETSNGRVEYRAAADATAAVDLRTSNGSIHVTLSKSIAANLELRTSIGRTRVDVGEAPLQNVRSGRGWFTAAMNGGGVPVNARTSNGSITLVTR